MSDEIVARILRLPGYGVYAWEAAPPVANSTLLSDRQQFDAPCSSRDRLLTETVGSLRPSMFLDGS
jgi:hypothetical protein